MDRLASLDGFRAIAVLIVIVSHAGLGQIVPGGLGVTLFFFLSGYLITTLMVIEKSRTGKIGFASFYLRRTVRIIPPMLLCISVVLLLTAWGIQPREIQPEGLIWDFLFLSNYASQLGVNSSIPIPLWSLDVEEHFYLIFPLIFVLSRQNILIILAAIVGVLVVRLLSYADHPMEIYYWSHTRIDSILFGCLLAMVNNPATNDKVYIDGKARFLIIGFAILMTTLVVRDEWFRETFRYSVQGIALLLIFNHALRAENIFTRALSSKWFKPTAAYSYVLYLIHFPMLLCTSQLALPLIAQNAIGIALSYAFAAATHRFMEQPLLRWRKAIQRRLEIPAELRSKGIK